MPGRSLPNTLELRSAPFIGLSYLSGALAGGSVGAGFSLIEAVGDQNSFAGTGITLMSATVDTFVLIAVVCLLVELVVATALLLAYRFFRWRFLTRWTAALIGLAIGIAP